MSLLHFSLLFFEHLSVIQGNVRVDREGYGSTKEKGGNFSVYVLLI